jgi:hypothetical protein
MAKILANRLQVAIASTLAASVNITGITNATEGVATLSSATGITAGDILVLSTPNWPALDGRVVRVKTVATNDVTLEGINTTSTTLYPAGQGAGTAREITAWQTITQIKKEGGVSASGGDQKFVDASTVDDDDDVEIPAGRTAQKITINVYDDESLPWYAVVRAAEDAGAPVPMRMVFANGSRILRNGYWGMGQMPSVNGGQINELAVSFSASGRATRYAT